MDRVGKIVFVTLFVLAMVMLVVNVKNLQRHHDIVIKTETQEFIVDDYHIDDNCIEFNYGGEFRTICGNYEIIE